MTDIFRTTRFWFFPESVCEFWSLLNFLPILSGVFSTPNQIQHGGFIRPNCFQFLAPAKLPSPHSISIISMRLPHRLLRRILSEQFRCIRVSTAWQTRTMADEQNYKNFYNLQSGGSWNSIFGCLSIRAWTLGTRLRSSCSDTLSEDTMRWSDEIWRDTTDWTSCKGLDLRQSLDSVAISWSLVWQDEPVAMASKPKDREIRYLSGCIYEFVTRQVRIETLYILCPL